MSKGFWIVTSLVFGVAFGSLSLFTYSKEIMLKETEEYTLNDYLTVEDDKECLSINNE